MHFLKNLTGKLGCAHGSPHRKQVREAVPGSHMIIYRGVGKLLSGGQIWLQIYFCKFLVEDSHAH